MPDQVEDQALGLVLPRRLGADRLVHDAVQFLQQRGHVGGVAARGQLLVDRLDVVVPLGVPKRRRLGKQRAEADEHLPHEDLEAALTVVAGIDRLDTIFQQRDAGKSGCSDQRGRVEAQAAQVSLCRVAFRADTAQARQKPSATWPGSCATSGAARKSLKRSRNSAALLSGDRLQGLSEMIQNADDAGATQVRKALLPDGLWVAHDGEPIQLEHVFGIAMPWITTEDQDPDATGRHGIGLMTLRALSMSLQDAIASLPG